MGIFWAHDFTSSVTNIYEVHVMWSFLLRDAFKCIKDSHVVHNDSKMINDDSSSSCTKETSHSLTGIQYKHHIMVN